MGRVQRAIEAAGVATVSVTMLPDLTRRVGVPRALAVDFPLGHPFGFPGEAFRQAGILREMLRLAADACPGSIGRTSSGGGGGEGCAACGAPPGT